MSVNGPDHARERALADLQALSACRIAAEADDAANTWLVRLQELRTRYLLAVDDADQIDPARRVLDTLRQSTEDSPADGGPPAELLSAWDAALRLLDAKHGFWPRERLRLLRDGLGELDRLVAAHPRQIEIRYLRLVNTAFLPGILGRGDSSREDLAVLARLLPGAAGEYPLRTWDAMVSTVLDLLEPDASDRDRLESARAAARPGEGPLAASCTGA